MQKTTLLITISFLCFSYSNIIQCAKDKGGSLGKKASAFRWITEEEKRRALLNSQQQAPSTSQKPQKGQTGSEPKANSKLSSSFWDSL